MIYFIKAEHDTVNFPASSIKIGTTTRLCVRLKQIAKDIGHKPTVLAVIPGGYADEKAIHDRFASWCIWHEWFLPCVELLSLIETEGKQWDVGESRRPIRVDLSTETHRLLRLVAADSDSSMYSFALNALDRLVRKEAERRGIQLH